MPTGRVPSSIGKKFTLKPKTYLNPDETPARFLIVIWSPFTGESYVHRKKVMQSSEVNQQQAVNEIYSYAANLIVNEKKKSSDVRTALAEKGLSEDAAYTIVRNVEDEIKKAKREAATKDMIYGALWCVGGTVATFANIGFIFWGAILFGGVQFIKGCVNYFSVN